VLSNKPQRALVPAAAGRSTRHPAIQNTALADQFRATFLRRLKSLTRRQQLLWPTADLLPTSHEALGMESCEQVVEFVEPAFIKTPLPAGAEVRGDLPKGIHGSNRPTQRDWKLFEHLRYRAKHSSLDHQTPAEVYRSGRSKRAHCSI
jgi:hypothetical protein